MNGTKGWGGLLLATIMMATTVSAQGAAVTPPAPTGQYAVGRRMVHWVDSTRADPVDPTRRREIVGWIWYPAAEDGTGEREAPLSGAWGERRSEALRTKLGAGVAAAMRTFRVSARTDAPLLSGASRLPVLLFTPGLGWLSGDYSVLVEDLASHGYVVVGIDSPGFGEVVLMPDGREVRRTLGMGEKVATDQAHVHADALFALGRIRALDGDAGSPLIGRLDLGRIGTFGHSLGGTTAFVAAARDSMVRAAINIDGDPMGEVLEVRPRQPLLLISSETPSIDEAPPSPSAEHRELTRQGLERSEKRRTTDWLNISSQAAEAYRIRIFGARHLNFPDAALASAAITTPEQRWMRVGSIAGERGLRITADLVREFFDHTLLGAGNAALLRDPTRRYPEARLEPRVPS
jgi:pimeloyl-ACP methyl ester carboxylesterase